MRASARVMRRWTAPRRRGCLVKFPHEVVGGNVHALAKIKTMRVEALHARVELEAVAAVLLRLLDQPREVEMVAALHGADARHELALHEVRTELRHDGKAAGDVGISFGEGDAHGREIFFRTLIDAN